MRRLKALAVCAAAMVCAMGALIALSGCQQQTYTPPEPTPQVSAPVIGEEGVLRVGVNTDKAPLAGTVSDKIVGIDVDMAAALADQLGLKLEVVDVGEGGTAALSDGTVDVLMGVSASDSLSSSYWKSDPYLTTSVALFAPSSSSKVPAATDSPTIAAQSSSLSAWAVTNEFEKANFQAVSSLKDAFTSLGNGSVGYVASDAVVGSYVARTANVDAHIVALLQQPSGYSVCLLDGNQELKRAVVQALSAVNESGIASVVEAKWLGADLDLDNIPLTDGAQAGGAAAGQTAGDTTASAGDTSAATNSSSNSAASTNASQSDNSTSSATSNSGAQTQSNSSDQQSDTSTSSSGQQSSANANSSAAGGTTATLA